MRNRVFSLWIVVALVVLGACALTVEGNSVVPTATGLSAWLEMPASLPDGETVKLQFTLTNNSDVELYVLKWYTPLEGIGGQIFRVERDDQVIPYVGILATRTDPTPEGYIRLAAGQSTSAEVDLATSFDFSQPGEYTVEFLSPRISHVARSEAEMARSVDDLGPVDIPANTVTVEIGGSTDEPAGTPTADDRVHYQGASPFYPDAQPFQIDYSLSLREYVSGDAPNQVDHLRHREIGRCYLWLGGGGDGTSPVSTASLAGYDWTIFQVQFDLLQYHTRWDKGASIFDLLLPTRYNRDDKGPCECSTEEMLRTIKVPFRRPAGGAGKHHKWWIRAG
jgi:peptidyl-Lys metalloendopeptidase